MKEKRFRPRLRLRTLRSGFDATSKNDCFLSFSIDNNHQQESLQFFGKLFRNHKRSKCMQERLLLQKMDVSDVIWSSFRPNDEILLVLMSVFPGTLFSPVSLP